MNNICNFIHDEEVLTTVENAVAGALISAAGVGAFTLLGARVDAVIDGICAAINNNTAC